MTHHETNGALVEGGCGIATRGAVSILCLGGEDRVRYLNGLVTCRVTDLEPGAGVYGFFTDNKGHILSDVVVRMREGEIWLEVAASAEATIREHLGKYIVADRVEVMADANRVGLTLVGDRWRSLPPTLIGDASGLQRAWDHLEIELSGEPLLACREERLGLPAITLWVPEARSEALREALVERLPEASKSVPESVLEAVRIRAGLVRFGIDFGPDNLPQETAIENAVDFDKGCYLGQEVVARLHYRGRLARALRPIRIDAKEPLVPGSRLSYEGREAGRVTSATPGLDADGARGIALIQRRAFDIGARLEADSGVIVEVVAV